MATVAQQKAAKEYGKQHGYAGNGGGWIFKDGQCIGQGWATIYNLHRATIRDTLAACVTNVRDFQQLVSQHPGYTPTIRTRNARGQLDWKAVALADEYDAYMRLHADSRRAQRS